MPQKDIQFSCEFFPPKTDSALEHLTHAAKTLSDCNPDFFSVTYGAGGTAEKGTKKSVHQLSETLKTPIVPHVLCTGFTKEKIKQLLKEYADIGIKRIVALRGDLPTEADYIGDFAYANELVAFIRQETGDHFKIKVAAYPEIHPESKTSQQDLINFKRKVDTGADSAITQYFFNVDSYFRFLEDCHKLKIEIPITPGIMPISNWAKLKQFSQQCGAKLPPWLYDKMESFGDDVDSIQEYGCEVVIQLCEKLLNAGVEKWHFYTLNQSKLTLKILEAFGVRGKQIESLTESVDN